MTDQDTPSPAQVRAGLQAVAPSRVRMAIEREDALALVDRLEGKQ